MNTTLRFLPTLVFGIVMVCWFVFGGVFLFRRRPPSPPDQTRDPSSHVGLVLQLLSYAVVGGWRREALTPIVSYSETLAGAASLLALVAAVGSVFILTAAIKTLGREWSITARLVEGHKLATTGPYAFVRHPIYTGMLGMLLATGLAVSNWLAIVAGLIVFAVGTIIRIRREERLLRAAFGQTFEAYARRVPALIPGLY